MTLAQVHNPSSPVEPGELDSYLSNAWFRMGQTIFTTHILHYDNRFYSALWLRIPLLEFQESSTSKKLKKLNAPFRQVIRPAVVDQEKEILFEKYKGAVSFEAAVSVTHLLFGKETPPSVYNTYEISLYDGDKLIAAGFFDLGNESAAGISSFYDPDYKKYSLGKFLIYLKIEYCQTIGMRYFYPGYFVPGHAVFDYKLDIAGPSLEYYSLRDQRWRKIAEFSPAYAPLEEMRGKLSGLSEQLAVHQLPAIFFYYEFYNANLTPEFKGLELFDFPVFLYCLEPSGDQVNPLLVYDVRDQQYHLLQCESLFRTDTPLVEGEHYASHLLKIWQELYSGTTAEETAKQLSSWADVLKDGLTKK